MLKEVLLPVALKTVLVPILTLPRLSKVILAVALVLMVRKALS